MGKKISVIFIIISCFAIILLSYISWNIKLDNIEKDATKVIPISTKQSGVNSSPRQDNHTNTFSITKEELKNALAKSDSDVQNLFEERYQNGKNIKMLILGSQAMDQGGKGYAKLLEESLLDTYGDFIDVSSKSFETSSADFIGKHLKDIKWSQKYDIVLFEPFILNDNGLVSIEDEFTYIDQVVAKVQSSVKDAVVVLQPSYPLYGTTYYDANVSSLEAFAEEKNLPYINHWRKWPSSSDEKLKDYLTDDSEQPNEKGAQLWGKTLSKYFTNQ